jgi:hypothetical protein
MRHRIAAAACLLGFAAAALGWSQKVGEVAYVEGDVVLVRNGSEMDSVQIGQDLQNYDLLRTGTDGLAELTVSTPSAPRMTLKISPKTQFSLEIEKLGKKQQTTVGLLTGTVALKVSRLAGSQAVSVRTEAAAMGVRGTEFTVTSPPSGDILVTCDEGEVLCDDGEAQLAVLPGAAVEKWADEPLRRASLEGAALQEFRERWMAARMARLRENALQRIVKDVIKYRRLVAAFDRNYAELMRQQRVLSKWQREDKAGRVGSLRELNQEKKDIDRHLKALRLIQWAFEPVYVRLLQLKDLHDQGFGRGTIEGGESTTLFFQRLEREKRQMQRKLAMVRWVTRMYALRNDGSVPWEASDEGFQNEEDFFDD